MMKDYKYGMTIRELKLLVKDLPEVDANGEDYEVWSLTSPNTSSQVKHYSTLNQGDILLGVLYEEP